MPRFAYRAFGPDGRVETGDIEADSASAALDRLARRSLTPTTLTEGRDSGPWYQRDIALPGSRKGLKSRELQRFFTTLSTLLTARLPLPRALGFCVEQTNDAPTRRCLTRLREAVENGASLGTAMEGEPNAIPTRFATLIRVGEAANRLEPVTSRIAATLEAEATLQRELTGALIYPLILLVMSLLVLGLIIFYLAPTLVPVFDTAGAPPPALLATMTELRAVLLTGWPLVLAGLGAGIVALWMLRAPLKIALRRLGLTLPLLGPYLRQRGALALCEPLQLMLSGGANLPEALRAARETVPDPRLADLIARTEQAVTDGKSLAPSLEGSPLLDPMTVAIIRAGEEANRLPAALESVTRDLRQRTGASLAQGVKLLTPVLTLVIGILVGGLILSTISAILDLNDLAF